MTEPRYYTAEQAAGKLGLHKGSLLRALRNETIPLQTFEAPAERTHRKFFFLQAEVDTLALQRRRLRRVTR